jgi:hypothetical protein
MAALAVSPLRVRKGQVFIAPTRLRRPQSLSLSLPEPHAGAAAILGDELDARRFEGGLYCSQRRRLGVAGSAFKIVQAGRR